MSETSHISTSNVHPFPTKARGQAVNRDGFASVTELHGPRLERTEFGSGWYHEAAMDEEAQSPRHDQH